MGKLLTLLVVLGAGFGIYWTQFHKSAEYKTYLKWVDATVQGDCRTLTSMAEGKASDWVTSYCTPAGGMTIFGKTIAGRSAADMVQEMRNSPAGYPSLRHHLESSTEAADGQMTLVITEQVLGRPSNFNKPPPDHKHTVILKPAGEDWKIVEFNDQELP